MGLINGVLVSWPVPSIIVTSARWRLPRVVMNYSGRNRHDRSVAAVVVGSSSANLFKIGGLDFRLMVGVALALVVIFQLVITYLPFGRRLYAIGSNPEAARVAGFPTQRIVMTAYVLCGMLSGLAGFMFLARFGNITVVAAQGMELSAIAAVVVGGVNVFGGSGTMIGALLGALAINTLEQSLIRWLQISEFWRDALPLLILRRRHRRRDINRLHNLGAERTASPATGNQGAEGGRPWRVVWSGSRVGKVCCHFGRRRRQQRRPVAGLPERRESGQPLSTVHRAIRRPGDDLHHHQR